jgi:small subunit ribosomal protein S15
MPLNKELKVEIIDGYQRHEGDTGSPEVQIALLSKRISQLTEHLRSNKHDESSAAAY